MCGPPQFTDPAQFCCICNRMCTSRRKYQHTVLSADSVATDRHVLLHLAAICEGNCNSSPGIGCPQKMRLHEAPADALGGWRCAQLPVDLRPCARSTPANHNLGREGGCTLALHT